jgi:nitroimidazol reductase NimA-like FMN-containing flavoprotein (pyridoxamine 5'-phosphate oxidase superfamily)
MIDGSRIIMAKEIFKMPRMKKAEYDRIIEEEYVCRIAFKGKKHPYIAPFLYVFDGRFMYFLSTNYGRKVQYFRENPLVVVEVERYSSDLSYFAFVTLPGRLVEIEDSGQKRAIREMFVNLVINKNLSANVMSALGHSPEEPVEALLSENRNSVWKLESVRADEILGLKSHQL